MDYMTDYLVELPAPVIFKNTIVPFLKNHGVIESDAIANNLHSIAFIALFYHIWFLVGKKFIFPLFASHVTDKKKRSSLMIQSSVHLVSFVQAIIVLYLSIKLMLDDENYWNFYHDSTARVFTESRGAQVICIYAIGYFTWDIYISIFHSTLPFVLHGIISVIVFGIGLKPYIQFYAPVFLMFELSNPALNIRWYLMKYAPRYKKLQMLNSFMLMVTFFCCRIAWGWYQIGKLCWDFYQVKDMSGFKPADTAVIVLGNFILDILNIVWFRSMVVVAIAVAKGKISKDDNKKKNK